MNEAVLALRQPAQPIPGCSTDLLDVPPAFLELLPVAVYACAADGRILWFNRRAVDLWGRAPRSGDHAERFCGSHKLYFDGRPIAHAETPMAQALRTGEPVRAATGLVERPDGSQIWAMVHIEPVKDAAGEVVGAINCFHDITEQKRAEQALAERERSSRELLDALPAAIYTTDAAGRITFYNRAAEQLSGRRPELGSDEWCVTWRLYNPDGTRLPHDQCPMAIALKENRPIRDAEAVAERPDGSRFPFIPYPTPLRDETGALVGAVNMLVDISERKQAETRQRALLDELNHRVKNTLATVQSLAAQTICGDGVPPEVRGNFDGRLFALSSAHDHLSRQGWESAELSAILEDLMAPFGGSGERIHVAGPEVKLPPRAALTVAMVLHELATNAAKYGALSAPEGRVDVSWDVAPGEAGRELAIDWQESGGPAVAAPRRGGFGMRLMQHGITRELGGRSHIEFDPAGIRARFRVPLKSVSGAE